MKQTKTIDLGNFNIVVVKIEDDQTLSYSILRHNKEVFNTKRATISALCYEVHKYLLSDLTYILNPLSMLKLLTALSMLILLEVWESNWKIHIWSMINLKEI